MQRISASEEHITNWLSIIFSTFFFNPVLTLYAIISCFSGLSWVFLAYKRFLKDPWNLGSNATLGTAKSWNKATINTFNLCKTERNRDNEKYVCSLQYFGEKMLQLIFFNRRYQINWYHLQKSFLIRLTAIESERTFMHWNWNLKSNLNQE